MDISRLIIHPIGLKNYACDPSDGHSSVCYYTCCSRNGSISNCTTRRGTSLGEEIAGCITYAILEAGCGDDEEKGEDADSEIVDQGSTNAPTVNPNQEDQTVTQDDTTIFGDKTVDLDEGNVGVPLAMRINGDIDEKLPTPPPSNQNLPPEPHLEI